MNADVVVDIGNTRIKWGRCSATGIVATAALPSDDPYYWRVKAEEWNLPVGTQWVLASVQPAWSKRFARWASLRGDHVTRITGYQQLPLKVEVPEPEKVGIDRLLDAVAANSRRRPGHAAAIVDAGSAVTVDLVDADGVFLGGVILPGMGMMARALHEHTALLPSVDIRPLLMDVPAKSTIPAIQAGIYAAVAGGVRYILEEYKDQHDPLEISLTGGDAAVLVVSGAVVWPELTLEGIRLSADRAAESSRE